MSHPSKALGKLRSAAVCVAVAVAAVVLAGCGKGETGASGGDTKFVQGTGEITKVAPGKRQAAPDIASRAADGKKQLKLSDFRGKVVVLNVWGSWCAPCRAEAPNLAKVAKDTEDQGVQFVGINTRDLDPSNARAFERNYDIDYPSFYDPSGRLILRFPRGSLSPQAIPSTLILDRDGKIAVRALKELSESELRAALKPLAGSGAKK
jgi:thiol-disulfide isomerase/thioredoxin